MKVRAPRRAVTRMKKKGAILYTTRASEKTHTGEIADLSPAGMRLICAQKLAPGTILQINSPDFRATAFVKNICEPQNGDPQGYAVGLEFITIEFYTSGGSFVSTFA